MSNREEVRSGPKAATIPMFAAILPPKITIAHSAAAPLVNRSSSVSILAREQGTNDRNEYLASLYESGTNTILPATPALSMRACASAICVSGNLAPMIGLNLPRFRSSRSLPRSS